MRRLVFSALVLGALAALALPVAWMLRGSGEAHSPGPGPGAIDHVKLDMDALNTPANQPNGPLGTSQVCASVLSDNTFQIDITVDETSPVDGLSGFSMTLNYDPTRVTIIAVDDIGQMISVSPGSGPLVSTSDPVPGTDGSHLIAATDQGSGYESGHGVLARVTLQAIASGFSGMTLTGLAVLDRNGQPIPVNDINNAFIAPWPVPPGDTDCDAFPDTVESFVGTDPTSPCGVTSGTPSLSWPPDFNGTQRVDIVDLGGLRNVFNSTDGDGRYEKRKDLSADGNINIVDVGAMRPVFHWNCAW